MKLLNTITNMKKIIFILFAFMSLNTYSQTKWSEIDKVTTINDSSITLVSQYAASAYTSKGLYWIDVITQIEDSLLIDKYINVADSGTTYITPYVYTAFYTQILDSIDRHTDTLQLHNTRLLALENAGGGSGQYSATIYVSDSLNSAYAGSDVNTGGFSDPLATLEKADDLADNLGFTNIIVMAGNYAPTASLTTDSLVWEFKPNTFIANSGVSSTYLFEYSTGVTPSIKGNASFTLSSTKGLFYSVSAVSASYEFECKQIIDIGGSATGLYFYQTDGDVNVNINKYTSSGSGKMIHIQGGGDYYTIKIDEFYNTGTGDMVYINGSANYLMFNGNYIEKTTTTGGVFNIGSTYYTINANKCNSATTGNLLTSASSGELKTNYTNGSMTLSGGFHRFTAAIINNSTNIYDVSSTLIADVGAGTGCYWYAHGVNSEIIINTPNLEGKFSSSSTGTITINGTVGSGTLNAYGTTILNGKSKVTNNVYGTLTMNGTATGLTVIQNGGTLITTPLSVFEGTSYGIGLNGAAGTLYANGGKITNATLSVQLNGNTLTYYGYGQLWAKTAASGTFTHPISSDFTMIVDSNVQ